MEKWHASTVIAWLEQLKQDKRLKFEVAGLACDGDLFTLMTKEDMKEMAGGLVGIHIFNAKEKKRGNATPPGTFSSHAFPSCDPLRPRFYPSKISPAHTMPSTPSLCRHAAEPWRGHG